MIAPWFNKKFSRVLHDGGGSSPWNKFIGDSQVEDIAQRQSPRAIARLFHSRPHGSNAAKSRQRWAGIRTDRIAHSVEMAMIDCSMRSI